MERTPESSSDSDSSDSWLMVDKYQDENNADGALETGSEDSVELESGPRANILEPGEEESDGISVISESDICENLDAASSITQSVEQIDRQSVSTQVIENDVHFDQQAIPLTPPTDESMEDTAGVPEHVDEDDTEAIPSLALSMKRNEDAVRKTYMIDELNFATFGRLPRRERKGTCFRIYVHHPNDSVNSFLTLLLALAVAAVAGLGTGHFLGTKGMNQAALHQLQLQNKLLKSQLLEIHKEHIRWKNVGNLLKRVKTDNFSNGKFSHSIDGVHDDVDNNDIQKRQSMATSPNVESNWELKNINTNSFPQRIIYNQQERDENIMVKETLKPIQLNDRIHKEMHYSPATNHTRIFRENSVKKLAHEVMVALASGLKLATKLKITLSHLQAIFEDWQHTGINDNKEKLYKIQPASEYVLKGAEEILHYCSMSHNLLSETANQFQKSLAKGNFPTKINFHNQSKKVKKNEMYKAPHSPISLYIAQLYSAHSEGENLEQTNYTALKKEIVVTEVEESERTVQKQDNDDDIDSVIQKTFENAETDHLVPPKGKDQDVGNVQNGLTRETISRNRNDHLPLDQVLSTTSDIKNKHKSQPSSCNMKLNRDHEIIHTGLQEKLDKHVPEARKGKRNTATYKSKMTKEHDMTKSENGQTFKEWVKKGKKDSHCDNYKKCTSDPKSFHSKSSKKYHEKKYFEKSKVKYFLPQKKFKHFDGSIIEKHKKKYNSVKENYSKKRQFIIGDLYRFIKHARKIPNSLKNLRYQTFSYFKDKDSSRSRRPDESVHRVNISADWQMKRDHARAKHRMNSRKSDWMFDRAVARQAKRNNAEKGDWYFMRARSRHYCRSNSAVCGAYKGRDITEFDRKVWKSSPFIQNHHPSFCHSRDWRGKSNMMCWKATKLILQTFKSAMKFLKA